jgi:choline dehydrogenase-like flavoprotein
MRVSRWSEIAAPRGKALGGSSTVNATVAMRARPSDKEQHRASWIFGETTGKDRAG